MRTQTTTRGRPAGKATQGVTLKSAASTSPAKQKSGRLYSWKITLFQSLGRELNALHRQQQERAFMATSHGLNYCERKVQIGHLH